MTALPEDDLDGLLDGCLDELNDQVAAHKAQEELEQQTRAQQLLAEQQAMDADPNVKNLHEVFMTLASALQNPGSLESEDGISKLQTTLASTIASLETDPNATDSEKAELTRCAEMVRNLGKPTADGAGTEQEMSPEEAARLQSLVADMIKSVGDGAGDTAAGPAAAGDDASMATLLKMMEAMQSAAPAGASGAPSAAGVGQSPTATDAPQTPGEVEGDPEAGLAAVMALMNSEQLAVPFLQMVDKYPSFLARATLSPEDSVRYNRQYEAVKEVAAFFKNGKLISEDDGDDEAKAAKLGQFSVAVQRLEALGPPPPELVGETATA